MSRLEKIVAFIAIAFGVVEFAFITHRNSATFFLEFAAVPIYLLTLLFAVSYGVYRKSFWPMKACLIAAFVAWIGGRIARECLFLWSFPSYQAIVEKLEAGEINVPSERDRVQAVEPEARFAEQVWAERTPGGPLVVYFDVEQVPLHHSGYLYVSSDDLPPNSRFSFEWQSRRKLKPHWYAASRSGKDNPWFYSVYPLWD